MPELPEVETSRRGILPYLQEKQIERVIVRNKNLRWPVSEEVFVLKDERVYQVLRRGKYIILELATGAILIHLGMSGSVRIVSPTEVVKKHDHVDFHLSESQILRFNDPRRFGCILWSEQWQNHNLIAHLGLEPLDTAFDGEYLHKAASNKTQAVKAFIMDSHIVVGVGNIYANEALFLAGIHPKRAASRISLTRYKLLVEKIKLVLSKAIKQGGTTLRDFVGGDGKPGYFKQQLNVYGRGGEPCVSCKAPLKEIRLGQRSTVFCGQCQK